MNRQKEEEIVFTEPSRTTSGFAAIVIIVWALLGILAFIFSLVCFAYDGSFLQNWVGFLTAIVLGPFYWIFYTYSDGYCTSGGRRQQQIKAQIVGKVQALKKKLAKKSGRKGFKKLA